MDKGLLITLFLRPFPRYYCFYSLRLLNRGRPGSVVWGLEHRWRGEQCPSCAGRVWSGRPLLVAHCSFPEFFPTLRLRLRATPSPLRAPDY